MTCGVSIRQRKLLLFDLLLECSGGKRDYLRRGADRPLDCYNPRCAALGNGLLQLSSEIGGCDDQSRKISVMKVPGQRERKLFFFKNISLSTCLQTTVSAIQQSTFLWK